MKTPQLKSASTAFTLIELLVVISIIAVLASLTVPAVTGAMVNARKAQAKNDMAQIANAIKLFYTEYGRYPVDTETATTDANAVYGMGEKGNDQIISVLRYKTSPSVQQAQLEKLNPRQIKFIEPKIAAVKKACVNTTSGKWFDPWGTQYVIFIDADYDGEIAPKGAFTSGLDLTDDKAAVSVGVASVGYYYPKKKQTQAETMSAREFDKQTDLLSWQ